MAKFDVTLADGRSVSVFAPDVAAALLQAGHQETTRVIIAAKRGHPQGPNASIGMTAVKVKD